MNGKLGARDHKIAKLGKIAISAVERSSRIVTFRVHRRLLPFSLPKYPHRISRVGRLRMAYYPESILFHELSAGAGE